MPPVLSTDRKADERRQRSHLEQIDLLASGYNRELQGRVRRLHEETARALRGTRRDADEDPPLSAAERAQLLLIIGRIAKAWKGDNAPDERELARLFARSDSVATTDTRRAIAATVRGRGVEQLFMDMPTADAKAMRGAFIDANVDLITSIDRRYLADVALRVDAAYRDGRPWRWIASELEDRYDVSKSRAQLIARDQLGKLTGQLTQVRNLELGIDSYQWMTSADERVRRSHERLEGRIFRWDEAPPFGHPGQDFRCRCTSRAVLDAAHAQQLQELAETRMRRQSLQRSPIVLGEIAAAKDRRLSPARIAEFRGEFRRAA